MKYSPLPQSLPSPGDHVLPPAVCHCQRPARRRPDLHTTVLFLVVIAIVYLLWKDQTSDNGRNCFHAAGLPKGLKPVNQEQESESAAISESLHAVNGAESSEGLPIVNGADSGPNTARGSTVSRTENLDISVSDTARQGQGHVLPSAERLNARLWNVQSDVEHTAVSLGKRIDFSRQRRAAEGGDTDDGSGRPRKSEKRKSRGRNSDTKKLKKLRKEVDRHQKEISALQEAIEKVPRAHFHAIVRPEWIQQAKDNNGSITTLVGTVSAKGLLPFDVVYKFWRETPDSDKEYFLLNQEAGEVTIRRNGTYFIYAQIVYHDESGRNSFGVFTDAQHEPIAQCLLYEVRGNRSDDQSDAPHATPHAISHNYFQQCNTNTVQVLTHGQKVYLKGIYSQRTLITKPALTFWGLVKLD